MQAQPSECPQIGHYEDYRSYLRDYFQFKKSGNRSFSLRVFSRLTGYRSSNFLKLVMDGKRNLSMPGVERLQKALALDRDESRFFRNLVLFNQAANPEEKQFYARELLATPLDVPPLSRARYEYWTQWYYAVIRELVNLPGFSADPQWIASTLQPSITPQQAEAAVRKLLLLGFLSRDAQNRLIQSEPLIFSGRDLVSPALRGFHQGMIEKGREALERFPKEERQISCVTITLDAEGMERAKQMITRVRKELLKMAGPPQAPGRVVQVNFQLFPVTGWVEEDRKAV